jgi:hypothetical protein
MQVTKQCNTTWQPIETAPQDELARFMVFSKRQGVVSPCSYWENLGGPFFVPEIEVCYGYDCADIEDATHWMPLPEPPE